MNQDFYNGFMSKCASCGIDAEDAHEMYCHFVKASQAATPRWGSWKDNLNAARGYWNLMRSPNNPFPWYDHDGLGGEQVNSRHLMSTNSRAKTPAGGKTNVSGHDNMISMISKAPQTAVDYGVGVIKNIMHYPWREAIKNRTMPRWREFDPSLHLISGYSKDLSNGSGRRYEGFVSSDDFNKAWKESEENATLSPQWDSKFDDVHYYRDGKEIQPGATTQAKPTQQQQVTLNAKPVQPVVGR